MKNYTIITLLFFSALIFGCKKENVQQNSFRASFQAVINNVPTSLTESNIHYWSCAGSNSNLLNTDSSLFVFELSLDQFYNQDSLYHNSVFVNFANHIPNNILDHTCKYPDLYEQTFRQLLKSGNYPFTFDSNIKSGIIVTWYDNKGVEWTSGRIQEYAFPLVPPDYSHNVFTISYSQPVAPTPSFYTWGQELNINFNCWVYNYYGDSLSITNAHLNGIYSYEKL